MAISGAQPRARIARAIWAYTLLDQKTLAANAGIKYSRLRAIMARETPDEATLDELLALARTADVPEGFALNGFAASDALDQRIATLDRDVSSARGERDALIRAVVQIARQLEDQFGISSDLALALDGKRGDVADPSPAEDRPTP